MIEKVFEFWFGYHWFFSILASVFILFSLSSVVLATSAYLYVKTFGNKDD